MGHALKYLSNYNFLNEVLDHRSYQFFKAIAPQYSLTKIPTIKLYNIQNLLFLYASSTQNKPILHFKKEKRIFILSNLKMFSDRFYKILYLLTQQGNRFGSCFISVNLESQIFVILDNPKIISRMKRNYNLVWVWAFTLLALVGKFYITGMT